MVRGLWVGASVDGAKAMQPLLAMPGVVLQWTMTGSYVDVLNALLGNPQDQPIVPPTMGMPNEDKASRYVSRTLSAAEWRSILDLFVTGSPNTLSYMYLEFYGGLISSYPLALSAFIHRDAVFNAVLDVFWYIPQDKAAAEQFLVRWATLLETVWNGEVYQNYANVRVPDFASNYWGSARPGLVAVKKKYDRQRHFDFAQAIPAAAPVGTVPPEVAAALARPIDFTGGLPPAGTA
jgi:hypothetical protein